MIFYLNDSVVNYRAAGDVDMWFVWTRERERDVKMVDGRCRRWGWGGSMGNIDRVRDVCQPTDSDNGVGTCCLHVATNLFLYILSILIAGSKIRF